MSPKLVESRGAGSVAIGGDVTNSIVVTGDNNQVYVLQAGPDGTIADFATPETLTAVRRRARPVDLRARFIRGVLDRDAEVGVAYFDPASPRTVNFFGSHGCGKSSLLRHLAHHASSKSWGDGVVSLSATQDTPGDFAMSLYDAFYESARAYKPSTGELRHALMPVRALVLVDELRPLGGHGEHAGPTGRDEAEALIDLVPQSTVFLTSERRLLWDGDAVALPGLPAADGVALIERELGRALSAEERTYGESICSALDGHPLHIRQVAAQARDSKRSIADLVDVARQWPSRGMSPAVLRDLSPEERSVMAMLSVLGDAPLGIEHISELSQVFDVSEVLDTLQRRRLVKSHSPSYSLTEPPPAALDVEFDHDRRANELSEHLATWAEEHRDDRKRVLEHEGALMAALEWSAASDHNDNVARLSKPLQDAHMLSGRWEAWRTVAATQLESGMRVKDRVAESDARHELGTRALGLGDLDTARSYLTDALDIRETLHDAKGAAVTRHNLEVAGGSSPPPPDPKSIVPKLVAALLGAVLLLAIVWVITRPDEVAVGAATLSPSELSFEDQIVGTTSAPRALTITNDGDDEISLQASIDARAFSLTGGSCAGGLAAGRTCTIDVAFSPRKAGLVDTTLLVDVDPGGDIEVPVSGAGIAAEVDISPTALSFGDVPVRESSETQSVTVSNPGGAALDVTVVPPGSGEFDIEDGCSSSAVEPGGDCTVAADFSPTAPGLQSAEIVIEHNAGGGALTVILEGNGVAPAIEVSPTSLTFEPQEVGTTSAPLTVTVANSGTAALETTVALDGTNPGEFAVDSDSCGGGSLAAGATCNITVVFQPSSDEAFNAALTIAHNAGDAPVTVALSGSGFFRVD